MLRVCLVTEGMSEDALNLWAYTLRHFVPAAVYLIGPLDVASGLKPFKNALGIEDARDVAGDLVVFSSPNARHLQPKHTLSSFAAPHDATYLFGSDCAHLTPEHLGGREAAIVSIEADTDDDMHGHVAAALALYDWRLAHG